MKYSMLICVLLLLPNLSGAGWKTGNDLYAELEDCLKNEAGNRTYENYYGCGNSIGYILGVDDMMSYAQSSLHRYIMFKIQYQYIQEFSP